MDKANPNSIEKEPRVMLEVENVCIRYKLGDFKDIGLKEWVMRHLTGNYHVQEFMAVHGVTFKINEGDLLGIIGSNGAGKSTLLKAIAGIMEPTQGYVRPYGSVVALLELASGFDGNLTVKENAYLRGAMLGYTKKFMDETYKYIVDFAELKEFEDRPFKQLSSGMQSRLAFSIASMVQPEILILDEVLSVGDGAFQQKSARKMREIIKGGATTILVSHSLNQIREMCNKVLWLHKGRSVAFGAAPNICNLYQSFLEGRIRLEQEGAGYHRYFSGYDYLIEGLGLYGAILARKATDCGKKCLIVESTDKVGSDGKTLGIRPDGSISLTSSRAQEFAIQVMGVEGITAPGCFSKKADQCYLTIEMKLLSCLWNVESEEEALTKMKLQAGELSGVTPCNLEELFASIIGWDLYNVFVRENAKQIWGKPCAELHVSMTTGVTVSFVRSGENRQEIIVKYEKLLTKLLSDTDVVLNCDLVEFIRENPNAAVRNIYATTEVKGQNADRTSAAAITMAHSEFMR